MSEVITDLKEGEIYKVAETLLALVVCSPFDAEQTTFRNGGYEVSYNPDEHILTVRKDAQNTLDTEEQKQPVS